MKKFAALTLLIFVFLAGCVRQQKEVKYEDGVSIKELLVEPNVIESMEQAKVIVTLLVQNVGGSYARNVKATLLGLDDWNVEEDRTQRIGDLYPANPSVGLTEGQESVVTWTLDVPSGKFTETTYPFSVKVSYDYSTVAEGIIRAVSSGYYRRTGDIGGIKSFSYTSGPLKISVKAPRTIFSSQSGRTIPILFEIENVGGGRTYLGDEATGLDYVVVIEEKPLKCPGKVYLSRGQRALATCSLEIGNSNQDYVDVSFRVNFTYGYLVEKPSFITVLPQLVTS